MLTIINTMIVATEVIVLLAGGSRFLTVFDLP